MKSRRNFIKTTSLATAGIMAHNSPAFSIGGKHAQPENLIIGHNDHKYKVDTNWAQVNPATHPVINCHEMVQDSQGKLYMIGDDTHNNIMVFDKSGELLDTWGHAFPAGHGLTISKENDEDFLLLVDNGFYTGADGKGKAQHGNVVKTDLKGRIIFSLAQPHTIGVYDDKDPYFPTETAVAPNGDIYVADGYGSDYILQFDAGGRFIRKFGGHNNEDTNHNLRNAHGVVVDTRDSNNPELICTSRDECCFKVFTLDGQYLRTIELPGMYVCRPVIQGDKLYAGVCWSKDADGNRKDSTGFLTILDAGNKVISSPGGTAPEYKNGALQQTFQDASKVFHHGHDVCIDEDENIYVCQWNANRSMPIKLTRV